MIEYMGKARALIDLIQDGDRIMVGTGTGEPQRLTRELVDHVLPERRNIEVIQVTLGGKEALASVPTGRGHRIRIPVGGAASERAVSESRAEPFPATMYQLNHLISSGAMKIDVALMSGSRRRDGTLSPGLSLDVIGVAARNARTRCLEIVSGLPRTRSVPWIVEGECELVREVDDQAATVDAMTPLPEQLALGQYLAELVTPGTTLELGVGAAFDGLAAALVETGASGMSIHTGLISESVEALVNAGVASRANGCCEGAVVVGGAIRGSEEFYSWVDENPVLCLAESSTVHDVSHLLRTPQFLAMNSASRLDVFGQVGTPLRHTLGNGGLLDFATAGAYGAGSVIALTARDTRGSAKIVPLVPHVGLSAQLVTHVVTEYGIAHLSGRTLRERADRIIAIAHPDDRERLQASSHQILD